jgi:3-methylcrotonyl-CoA carboxylase alpha subunit
MKLPPLNENVRVDAGFVQGDEVSSHYDPMIAKLIVRGPDRKAALQKLHAALESYEVAGPVTNIEFLKKLCISPAVMEGDVETGYIQKHHSELFARKELEPEVLAQAAIGLLVGGSSSLAAEVGFLGSYQEREFHLQEVPADGKGQTTTTSVLVSEIPSRNSKRTFDVTIGDIYYPSITISPTSPTTFTSFFPHTRLSTTLIRSENHLTLFQRGSQYKLQIATPKWVEKALGVKDMANSVVAPMPCKVLRVDVKAGDVVKRDQALVVIESMKMETVIRSPVDGIVKRIVHGAGVSLKLERF